MYEKLAKWYDVLYGDSTSSTTNAEMEFLSWAFSKDGPAKCSVMKVLDASAGTGRQYFRLLELGFDALASDASPDMLNVLKEKAEKRCITVQTYNYRYDELPFVSEFDALITLFSAFNHVTENAEVLESLKRFHTALRPGGVLVLDIINVASFLERYEKDSVVAGESNGYIYQRTINHSVDPWAGHLMHREADTIVGSDGKAYGWSGSTSLRIFGPKELDAWLMLAGFVEIQRFNGYGDYPGGSGPGNGARLIYIATKT